ncbi:nicotinamidase-related amidase [Ewingella americana]
MTRSALLNIDVQRSFEHRPFWQEEDLPAFQQALNRLNRRLRDARRAGD